jgi:putative FmdB family regulatory protein
MPIYEYRCAACGQQGEHLQKISEPPLSKCPKCGKRKYQKQLTAAGFQLKGSGWYATDFRNKSSPAPKSGEDAKPESKTEGKTESTTEAKPEAKTEPKKKKAKSETAAD